MKINQAIMVAMARRSVNAATVAKRMGVSRQSLSANFKSENGIKLSTLIAISEAIGCKLSEVIIEMEREG